MITMLSTEYMPRRSLWRRMARRADNPRVDMRSTPAGPYALVTQLRYPDMSNRESIMAERELLDELYSLSARRVIMRRGGQGEHELRALLTDAGIAVEDGLEIRRAMAHKCVSYLAELAGIPPALLRIGVLDPDFKHARTSLRRMCMLARRVALVTGAPDRCEDLRSQLLDEMGAAFTVSDELSALRDVHVIVCYGGLEQLLGDRSVSAASVVLNLQEGSDYAARPRQIVCDGLHFSYDAERYGPLPEWVPRQEIFSLALSEWIGFRISDLSISGFTFAGELQSVLKISMKLNSLDSK